MKKLLTIFLIFVLALAGLIFYLKNKEDQGVIDRSEGSVMLELHAEETELVLESHETPALASETGIFSKLESFLPEMTALEKLVLVPQILDIVKNDKEVPDEMAEELEAKGVDLSEAEGESFKDKLSFYISKYKDEILAWLEKQ